MRTPVTRSGPADERRAEAVPVSPVHHLAELDLSAGVILGLLLAAEQRLARLETEQPGTSVVGRYGLHRETGPRRAQRVAFLEHSVQGCLVVRQLVEARRERQRD